MRARSVIFFLASAFVFAAPIAQADDPLVGTWKQNNAKSSYDPVGGATRSQMVKIEAAGSGYKLIIDVVNGQGVASKIEYTASTLDGKDYPVTSTTTGAPAYNSIAYKRLDPNTIIMIYKLDGVVNRISRRTEAKDGKTDVIDTVGYTAAGVAFRNSIFFDKQ